MRKIKYKRVTAMVMATVLSICTAFPSGFALADGQYTGLLSWGTEAAML